MKRGRSNKGRWYVSYAWADDSNPKLEEKVIHSARLPKKKGLKFFVIKRPSHAVI